MSDDLINRMTAAFLDKVPSPCRTYGLSNAMRSAMTAALSALRPGDELPGGMVVGQNTPIACQAQTADLCLEIHSAERDEKWKEQSLSARIALASTLGI